MSIWDRFIAWGYEGGTAELEAERAMKAAKAEIRANKELFEARQEKYWTDLQLGMAEEWLARIDARREQARKEPIGYN